MIVLVALCVLGVVGVAGAAVTAFLLVRAYLRRAYRGVGE